jgi:hypothetical protein
VEENIEMSEEATGVWKKFHKLKFHNCKYFPRNIIRVIKQGIMRWAGHIRNACGR